MIARIRAALARRRIARRIKATHTAHEAAVIAHANALAREVYG